jgi:hypothetical protein
LPDDEEEGLALTALELGAIISLSFLCFLFCDLVRTGAEGLKE